ncbi:MAG: hypothetical protein M3Y27_09815 [Acidobacteriota bacterium]|nr:hypothetical protein [Acidobacteriota bacterium]
MPRVEDFENQCRWDFVHVPSRPEAIALSVWTVKMPRKPREMVTGPEAFENFKRLMTALLGVPKGKVDKGKPKPRLKPKVP